MMEKGIVVGAATLLVMVVAGCGGSDAGTPGTTVPGDRALNSLSDAEVASLCADAVASSVGLKQDACRLTGFVAAFFQAGSSSTATDAELQAACLQSSMTCLNNTTAPYCPLPSPAGCTATVADFAACVNDSAVRTHALASKTPACAELKRATIVANSEVGSALAGQPASCQSYAAKCQSSSRGTGDGGLSPAE